MFPPRFENLFQKLAGLQKQNCLLMFNSDINCIFKMNVQKGESISAGVRYIFEPTEDIESRIWFKIETILSANWLNNYHHFLFWWDFRRISFSPTPWQFQKQIMRSSDIWLVGLSSTRPTLLWLIMDTRQGPKNEWTCFQKKSCNFLQYVKISNLL